MSGPNFDGVYSLTSPPLRHLFMAATVWRLAADFPGVPLRILEVGSWCGASALTWAHALAEYVRADGAAAGRITCVDPWEPYIDTAANGDALSQGMEQALRADEPFRVFQHNMGFRPPGVAIEVVRRRSADALPALPGAHYHLVYLDGDHRYASVRADLGLAARLVTEGGVMCGDDLELQAGECTTAVVDAVPGIDMSTDTASGIPFHPGVTRAVGERFGRVSAWHGYWAMRRHGAAWAPVSLEGMPVFVPPYLPPGEILKLKVLLLGGAFGAAI